MFRLFGTFLVFIVAVVIGLDLLATHMVGSKPVLIARRITEFIAICLVRFYKIIAGIISKAAGQSAHKLAVNVNG